MASGGLGCVDGVINRHKQEKLGSDVPHDSALAKV